MSQFEFDTAVRFLTWIFSIAFVWLILSFVAALVGEKYRLRDERIPIPRWIRVAAFSFASFVFSPRVSAASAIEQSMKSLPSNDPHSDDLLPVALIGSISANAVFCAAHVRRRIVRLRSERFTRDSGNDDETLAASPLARAATPESNWLIVVKVLGPPLVETREGNRVNFTKSKALELVVWMAEHRRVSTRSAARTAIWEEAVRDSTFSNVVSDARRALNAAVPLDDEEWIPRTFSDELPLHSGVITDAELLETAIADFVADPTSGSERLGRALTGVRNLPFSGADYSWADGEGITTSHVIKVVKAAALLGEYAIQTDDVDLLFAATECGLRVLPGHEQLVALRMHGHARTGNRTAIKFEWESYARAIESDTWAGAVPSIDLEALAQELSRS